MSTFGFVKATKTQSRLRLGLIGPSGSGKTYTALRIAKGLGTRIAVIDTERGSASKYAGDVADFDVLELDSFAPATYVQAIRAADEAGYEVLVIDSLTHAWTGKDGTLEMVDRIAKRSGERGNSFAAWREVTPEHNALVDAILRARCHVIVTMRVKTEYVLEENERGKKVPRKVGLAPIQRDGLEYEMDVVADLDHDHNLIVSKTRCAALDRAVFREAGEDVAGILKRWLSDGAPAPAPKPTPFQAIKKLYAEADTHLAVQDATDYANSVRQQLSREERAQVPALKADAIRRVEEALLDQEGDGEPLLDHGDWVSPPGLPRDGSEAATSNLPFVESATHAPPVGTSLHTSPTSPTSTTATMRDASVAHAATHSPATPLPGPGYNEEPDDDSARAAQ